jgi:hypothetical protein
LTASLLKIAPVFPVTVFCNQKSISPFAMLKYELYNMVM